MLLVTRLKVFSSSKITLVIFQTFYGKVIFPNYSYNLLACPLRGGYVGWWWSVEWSRNSVWYYSHIINMKHTGFVVAEGNEYEDAYGRWWWCVWWHGWCEWWQWEFQSYFTSYMSVNLLKDTELVLLPLHTCSGGRFEALLDWRRGPQC